MITFKIQITETGAGISIQRHSSAGTASSGEIAAAEHVRTTLDDTIKALSNKTPLIMRPATRSAVPSVNDTWTFFADSIYKGVHAAKRIECKRAYMAGCLDMLMMLQEISKRFSEDEAFARIEVMRKELTIFFNSITSQDNPEDN